MTLGKLFGSSGVRGIVNVSLTPQLASKVSASAATHAKAKQAVVGRDTRTSGSMLEDALVSGLTSVGANVSLLGIVPTPAVAYLTREFGADVGFMITASHNPPKYNGIKVFRGDSLSYTNEDQIAVEKIVTEEKFAFSDWSRVGKSAMVEASQTYMALLKKASRISKRWRVIVDPGCGATFSVVPSVLNALGCQITTLNAQPDGHFPGRSSEPTAESLTDLSKLVNALGADLGVAFDGDGDRAAFVDEDGTFVNFDRSLAAYSGYVLKKNGGGTVVTNVEASMCVETVAAKFGGKVIRAPVGDVYVSESMRHNNAVFGGEPCGAWVHPQFHWCPDGPLSAVLVLSALEEEDIGLRDFIEKVPEYVTLRENIACRNESKQNIISAVKTSIKADFPSYIDYNVVDGVRLALRDGWILIRASGTEPLIRLTVEGESLKAARDIMRKGVSLVNEQIEAP
jgi:phosphoglucosamine mutase